MTDKTCENCYYTQISEDGNCVHKEYTGEVCQDKIFWQPKEKAEGSDEKEKQ